jgi:hypothetical protein
MLCRCLVPCACGRAGFFTPGLHPINCVSVQRLPHPSVLFFSVLSCIGMEVAVLLCGAHM